MAYTVPPTRHNHKANPGSLYTPKGARKYLTRDERQRVLPPLSGPLTDIDLMVLMLAWTGARISEVLALTPQAFQVEASVVALNTLKRRRPVVREVPIPRELMAALDRRYGLTATRQDRAASQDRLWPCCRATAWRHMKIVMAEAGVAGHPACPRGLRHGFAVGSLQSGVPLPLVQRWMGHTSLKTTAIYAQLSGPEERGFADGFFRWSGERAA